MEVKKQLGELIIEIIRNDNIKRENLTRKEVHVNKDRIKVFVMNLIADIWKVWISFTSLCQINDSPFTIMQNKNAYNSRISQISNFTAILITRILSLNNANTINSPCNHDFNVSLGIHVQNVGINQISYNLDLKSLIDLRKFFTNNSKMGYLINPLISKISDFRVTCKK